MEHPLLKTETYTPGTAKEIRESGKVPSVVYGHGMKTENVVVDKQNFRRVYRKAGKATLIDLEVSGKKFPFLFISWIHIPSLVIPYIDFHAVRMNEEVHCRSCKIFWYF